VAPRERASLRLLLVDDEPLVLTALHRQLSPYFLAVETAPTVALAVERLKQRAPQVDVVICDLMMPDGGGEQLLRELATLEPPFQGHTLFMTGGASTALSQRFAAEHAGQVLQKPISLDVLLEHLRSLR
jgi:CheY-like chemotaxis protein